MKKKKKAKRLSWANGDFHGWCPYSSSDNYLCISYFRYGREMPSYKLGIGGNIKWVRVKLVEVKG